MKQRGARMSKMQQEVYIKFLEHNPNFSTGTNSISYDLSTRERDFDRLVDQLNGTPGAVKDRKHWQETLADWRSKLLKRYRYHYSEEVRNSMSESAVKNLKKFDEFDVRALKALGKWENDHGGASKVLNNRKRKRRRVYRRGGDDESESDQDDQDEQDEDDSEDNDFYSLMSPTDPYNCLNVKTEVEIEDPLVEEIPAPIINSHMEPIEVTPQVSRRKRKSEIKIQELETQHHLHQHEQHEQEHYEQNDQTMNYERVLLENTKAMKQHTAAIVGLTDALHALTSTIRTYMYSK